MKNNSKTKKLFYTLNIITLFIICGILNAISVEVIDYDLQNYENIPDSTFCKAGDYVIMTNESNGDISVWLKNRIIIKNLLFILQQMTIRYDSYRGPCEILTRIGAYSFEKYNQVIDVTLSQKDILEIILLSRPQKDDILNFYPDVKFDQRLKSIMYDNWNELHDNAVLYKISISLVAPPN